MTASSARFAGRRRGAIERPRRLSARVCNTAGACSSCCVLAAREWGRRISSTRRRDGVRAFNRAHVPSDAGNRPHRRADLRPPCTALCSRTACDHAVANGRGRRGPLGVRHGRWNTTDAQSLTLNLSPVPKDRFDGREHVEQLHVQGFSLPIDVILLSHCCLMHLAHAGASPLAPAVYVRRLLRARPRLRRTTSTNCATTGDVSSRRHATCVSSAGSDGSSGR
jgi:hypothetical protein